MDHFLRLDPALPKGRAVERAVRSAIACGAVPVGTRLPSSRDLAAELGVSRNTVTTVYDDLHAEGVLETRRGSGTFVTREPPPPAPAPPAPDPVVTALDLRPGRPETGSFPTGRWSSAARRALHDPTFAAGDLAPAGSSRLRTELAAYLARARGVAATPETIVICSGYRGACTLLAAALAEHGAATVAIEDPSLPGISRPFTGSGLSVLDLPVDGGGAQVEHLGNEADLAVLTPAHQFPLGGTLHPRRRLQACAWAAASGRYLLEDDYDGEFRFDRRPIAALQRSAPEDVVYAGSTSKSLSPHLRLGWLVLPPELVAPVTTASEALTGGVPLLDQLTLAELIAAGDYERHIRRRRREYGRRRARLREALARAGIDTPGIEAGLHAVVPAGAGVVDRVARGPLAHPFGSVGLHTLEHYSRTACLEPAVVAGFGTPPRRLFEQALDALVDLVQERRST